MIVATGLTGRSAGVFGLARTGMSAIRSLRAGGAEVFAWDDKESVRVTAAAEGAIVEPWESWPWSGLAALILSPGVPLTHPEPHPIVECAKAAGVEIIGDMELFARTIRPNPAARAAAPIIAI